MDQYELKSEFKGRLVKVYDEISRILMMDCDSCVPCEHPTNLLPALFSLFTYMWCKSWSDFIKRVK